MLTKKRRKKQRKKLIKGGAGFKKNDIVEATKEFNKTHRRSARKRMIEERMENSGEWRCKICSFINSRDSNICEICKTARPTPLPPRSLARPMPLPPRSLPQMGPYEQKAPKIDRARHTLGNLGDQTLASVIARSKASAVAAEALDREIASVITQSKASAAAAAKREIASVIARSKASAAAAAKREIASVIARSKASAAVESKQNLFAVDKNYMIKESELGHKELLVDSGGGYIYKVNINGKFMVYKKLKGNDINGQMNKINSNMEKFSKIKGSRYLAGPIYIVTDKKNNKIGYIMEYLDGYDSIYEIETKNKYKYELKTILPQIILGIKDLENAGLTFCAEHAGNIMYNNITKRAIIIDLDGLMDACENPIKQLEFIFMNSPLSSTDWEKYFNQLKSKKGYHDGVKFKSKFKTLKDILDFSYR